MEVSPEVRRAHAVAQDLLEGMGKDCLTRGAGRNTRRSWEQALAWLRGYEVDDLVVNRAQNLDRGGWNWLCELASVSQLRLWFVVQTEPLSRGLREGVRDWQIRKRPISDLKELIEASVSRAASIEVEGSKPAVVTFPRVPEAQFTTFRHECRTCLEAEGFAVVDDCYRAVMTRLEAEAAPNDSDRIYARLIEELDGAESVDEALVVARAAQAGLFNAGRLLQVDHEVLRQWAASAIAARLDEQARALLSRLADPSQAMLAAVPLLTGLNPRELTLLNVGELVCLEEAIKVRGKPFSATKSCHPLIRAGIAHRQLQGGGQSDPLFVVGERGSYERAPQKALRNKVRALVRETGLPLAGSWTPKEGEANRIALTRRGLQLHPEVLAG
jgi:hypothetical protein